MVPGDDEDHEGRLSWLEGLDVARSFTEVIIWEAEHPGRGRHRTRTCAIHQREILSSRGHADSGCHLIWRMEVESTDMVYTVCVRKHVD